MKRPSRLELHEILCELIGSRNVYFQPPPDEQMEYPCIVYSEQVPTTWHADNYPYEIHDRYRLVVIDEDPDSILPKKVIKLQGARAAQPYVSDNLHHWPFEISPVSKELIKQT